MPWRGRAVEVEGIPTAGRGGRLTTMANRTGADPDVLHRQAQAALLSGLRRGDDVDVLIAAVASADVRSRLHRTSRCSTAMQREVAGSSAWVALNGPFWDSRWRRAAQPGVYTGANLPSQWA